MEPHKTAELFKALGDPGRLSILTLLGNPPPGSCGQRQQVCACDLTEHTGLSQPTVSHHMKVLVQAGLVSATKRGRWTDYALDPTGIAHAQAALEALAREAAQAQPAPASESNTVTGPGALGAEGAA